MFLLSYGSVNLQMLQYAIFRQLFSPWQVPCFLLWEGWCPVVLLGTRMAMESLKSVSRERWGE